MIEVKQTTISASYSQKGISRAEELTLTYALQNYGFLLTESVGTRVSFQDFAEKIRRYYAVPKGGRTEEVIRVLEKLHREDVALRIQEVRQWEKGVSQNEHAMG